MNKRGQFYLVGAIVIIAILIGFSTIYTRAEAPAQDTRVFDLSKEINYEGGQVIDMGVYNGLPKNVWHTYLENLTDYYALNNPGTDLIVVYGDLTEMFVVFYTTKNTGSIGLNAGSVNAGFDVTQTRRLNTTFIPDSNEVTILIDQDVTQTFNIKPGQTFFVIIKKVDQGEQYVAASNT